MEKLVKVRTEHPIFKAIEEKVVREIFEEIEHLIIRHSYDEGWREYIASSFCGELAELKKKYLEVHDDRATGD
jgi:hypothetical protein